MFKKNETKYEYDEESSKQDTALGLTKNKKESQSYTLAQDSKFDMTSPIKLADETVLNKPNENETIIENPKKENFKKLSEDEIRSLIDNKRSELDIRIFDMVTKNQIEEKKLEEDYNMEENEEEKENKLKKLENLIKENENNLNEMKE